MARVAKLLRAMPELVIMVKALKAAMRSVFFTLVLLCILLYVFGITFAQLCYNSAVGDELFGSVAHSMYSLLLYGVLCLDFLDDIAAKLNRVGFYMPPILFIFVLLSALTVMNMLIGVLCEVVNNVAQQEKERNLMDSTKSTIWKVLDNLDVDGNQMISRDELLGVLEDEQACKAFHECGVDVIGLVDFASTLFWDPIRQEEVELDFSEFMDRSLKLRSTNQATVKDILGLAKIIHAVDVRITDLADYVAKTDDADASISYGIYKCRASPKAREQSIN